MAVQQAPLIDSVHRSSPTTECKYLKPPVGWEAKKRGGGLQAGYYFGLQPDSTVRTVDLRRLLYHRMVKTVIGGVRKRVLAYRLCREQIHQPEPERALKHAKHS